MKSLYLVLLAVSAVAAAENLYCAPGSSFKMDCNTCTCSSDGTKAACTDMQCPEGNANVNDFDTVQAQPLCTPGERFELDEGTDCICNADGTTVTCTMGFSAYFTSSSIFGNTQTCYQGAVCDMELSTRRALLVRDQQCQGGKMFRPDSCNLCKCSNDGTKAVCTQKLCEENEVSQQLCQPGSQFQDYCNTCTCSEDGSSYDCTKMFCDKELWNQDGSLKFLIKKDVQPERVCEPGKAHSPDGCNSCICNQYGTAEACTYEVCLAGLEAAYQSDDEKKWGPLYKDGDACTPGRAENEVHCRKIKK